MLSNRSAAGVVLAGGSGSRVGAEGNKVYLPLAGRPVLAWSLRAFAAAGVGRLVLVVRPQDRTLALDTVTRHVDCPVELVVGGAVRHDSEHNALSRLAPDIRAGGLDVVAIHDGARPLVRPELVRASLDAARRHGAAVPGVPVDDIIPFDTAPLHTRPSGTAGAVHCTGGTGSARCAGGVGDAPPAAPPERAAPAPARLVRVQTPQAFRAGPLLDAYEQAARDRFTGTDTAACVERYTGLRVHHFAGDVRNLKVTYRHDLAVAAELLEQRRHDG